MLKKIFLPIILIILTYGFWLSDNFKEITAGIAIFLFGMLSLEKGFKVFTGGALEKLLKASTNSLWKSLSFGALTTSIMQSSSLVSVISISFLSAGLLGLSESIGIIFGANLGTTTGAWLVAGLGLKVKISAYAMPMLVFGLILTLQKQKNLKGLGYILTGLGFLFLGIHYMKEGFAAFKDTIDLAQFAVSGFAGLLIFTGIGIVATFIMQSSHATLVLIITALAAQQITYENALALAIGANIGTTITAILGAMSSSIEGKRLAGAHLIFNLVTGLIAIIFIQQFLTIVNEISLLLSIEETNYTIKLAIFHTLFNLVGIMVMLPFINTLIKYLKKILKNKSHIVGAKYLTGTSIDYPETAVEAVRQETLHIYKISSRILCTGINIYPNDLKLQQALEQILKNRQRVIPFDIDDEYETQIKGLYSEIIEFISHATFNWQAVHSDRVHKLRLANQHIVEAIKDMKHLRKNMDRHMLSQNIFIREQYNILRYRIALVMQEISQIKKEQSGEQPLLLVLDSTSILINEFDDNFTKNIIQLLQQRSIPATVATSLMNDNQYTTSICKNLISMATNLFCNYDEDKLAIEREVSLTEDNEKLVLSSEEELGEPHER